MKTRIKVTYEADVDIGDLPVDAVKYLIEQDDGVFSLFDLDGDVDVSEVVVEESKKSK